MNHQPDVMKLLADVRPVSLDPPPDAGRRARDIGLAIAVGPEVDSASTPRVSPGASRRPDERSPRRAAARSASRATLGLGLAVTAGAAAIAVLAATVGNGAPPPTTRHSASSTGHPASPGGGQPALSPAAVLLLAAANAAKAPSTGRYWHVITTTDRIDPVAKGGVIGAPAPTGTLYAIDVRGRTETWDAPSPPDRSWLISQDLGARPASGRAARWLDGCDAHAADGPAGGTRCSRLTPTGRTGGDHRRMTGRPGQRPSGQPAAPAVRTLSGEVRSPCSQMARPDVILMTDK